MSITVLGFDTGFRSFGWAVATIDGRDVDPIALGVVRTARDSKIPKLADNHRRLGFISREILRITKKWSPDVICVEALALVGGGQISQGYAWGVLEMLVEVCGVGLIQANAQAIKKATAGPKTTKKQVQAALDDMFDGAVDNLLAQAGVPGSQHEHPVDALGSIVASLNHDLMRMAKAIDLKLQREQQERAAHNGGAA